MRPINGPWQKSLRDAQLIHERHTGIQSLQCSCQPDRNAFALLKSLIS
jgi:hypothetical protein